MRVAACRTAGQQDHAADRRPKRRRRLMVKDVGLVGRWRPVLRKVAGRASGAFVISPLTRTCGLASLLSATHQPWRMR